MGTMSYDAIIVSGDNDIRQHVTEAHAKAVEIASQVESHGLWDEDFAQLISPVVMGLTNGEAAFFIAPDGSKEWWATSDAGDAMRQAIVEALRVMDVTVVQVQRGELGNQFSVDGRWGNDD